MDQDLKWEQLTEWHEVETPYGEKFRERFTQAALEGVEPVFPIRFRVLREEWNHDQTERVIHEVQFE